MKFAVAALLVVGAVAFGFGINWGVPTGAVDSFLISASEKQSYVSASSLSGAGIDHLAGGWENDPNRAADVAMHPIADRSKPVTLLENPITIDEILKTGDAKLPLLIRQQNLQYQKWQAASNSGKAQQKREQDLFNKDKALVDNYVDQYNQVHLPGYKESPINDPTNRARILRRYRLYSSQPDEMITLRSLSQMHPGQFDLDPRMYQYGGLWIYPIAGIIKFAGLISVVTVTSDRGYYLEHPEQFARLYMLMRGYSALWGLIGVLAVFGLVRRATGGLVLPIIAGLCFIFLPVVLSLSHEAKPHLAGVTLTLLAIFAASKYIATEKAKWAIWTGIACGAATGIVLSAIVALAIIPLMSLLRKDKAGQFFKTCVLSGLFAVGIYFVTNPYVAIHLILPGQSQVLRSNLGNTAAMYQHGSIGESLANAIRLIAAGTSVPLAILGIIGCLILLIVKRKPVEPATDSPAPIQGAFGLGWLLAAVAFVASIQFAIFAANKPPEYARFAALIDVALMMAAVVAIPRVAQRPAIRAAVGAILVIAVVPYAAGYLAAFGRDTGENSSRTVAAQQIDSMLKTFPAGKRAVLGIYSEPAPYCLPPVNLYRWKIVLLNKDYNPKSDAPHVDVIVQPNDSFNILNPAAAPITWANTPFDVVKIN